MPEDQTKSTVSGRVPPDQKESLVYLADGRNDPLGEKVTLSTIVAEAVDEYLENHQEELQKYHPEMDATEVQEGAA